MSRRTVTILVDDHDGRKPARLELGEPIVGLEARPGHFVTEFAIGPELNGQRLHLEAWVVGVLEDDVWRSFPEEDDDPDVLAARIRERLYAELKRGGLVAGFKGPDDVAPPAPRRRKRVVEGELG